MHIKSENTTTLPPTVGFIKIDGCISCESKLFLEHHLAHQQEHHIGFMQYFYHVSCSSLSVVYLLHCSIGLCLLPLKFIVLLIMMILKLLVLNPPLCLGLQSTIHFEMLTLARVPPSMNFCQGMETIYSFNNQTTNCPNMKSRFIASRTSPILQKDIVLRNFFTAFAFYGCLQDIANITLLQLPLWTLHPFTGVVFLKE